MNKMNNSPNRRRSLRQIVNDAVDAGFGAAPDRSAGTSDPTAAGESEEAEPPRAVPRSEPITVP